MKKALFLDRDGVVNEDYGYVHRIDNFDFRPGIFEVCHAAMANGWIIIIVTNQAGIARGIYARADFDNLMDSVLTVMLDQGIIVSGVYACPYHPTAGRGVYCAHSYDRKPNPGMFVKACNEHNINPGLSMMIGDQDTDRLASSAVGIRCYIDAKTGDWVASAIKMLNA